MKANGGISFILRSFKCDQLKAETKISIQLVVTIQIITE